MKTRKEVASFIEEQFDYESTRSTKEEYGRCKIIHKKYGNQVM